MIKPIYDTYRIKVWKDMVAPDKGTKPSTPSFCDNDRAVSMREKGEKKYFSNLKGGD